MGNEYQINIPGLGNYVVDADVKKIKSETDPLECSVEIQRVKKFDESSEEYHDYEPEKDETALLENAIAVKFFNSLH